MATTEELVRIDGQAHEILKRVGNGSLDSRSVRKALQDIIEGKLSQDARFDGKLLLLGDQLDLLRRYNAQYWDNRLTEEQFSAIEREVAQSWLGHTQRLDDLAIFHVQFDSLEETVEMWWRVYVGEQPDSWRWPELRVDAEHLKLIGANVATYEPGVHVVRINLVAHWEPEGGRTLEEVRDGAKGTDEILAQLEVLSAYGLHTDLFREQDGENLPYSDMPGTDVSTPGYSKPRALCVAWAPSDREAMLGACWVDFRNDRWAAPVLIRES